MTKLSKKKTGKRRLPPAMRRDRRIVVQTTGEIADELAERRERTGQTESQQLVSAYLAWRDHRILAKTGDTEMA